MDAVNYGDNRWSIVFGKYEGPEKVAVNQINAVIGAYTPYILTANPAKDIRPEQLKSINPVLIGTAKSNPYIAKLVQEGVIKESGKTEGYTIKVMQSAYNKEKQMIVITGDDEAGLLYGSMDFDGEYLQKTKYPENQSSDEVDFFDKPMEEFELISAPKVANRAIWTWGHVIYNYEKFICNMVKLKLNMVVIWNDFVPVNAKDMIDYAHAHGIKVIWGYSWGWGVDLNLSNERDFENWVNIPLKMYEEQYAHLNGDGLYFQSFTETADDTKDGLIIAEEVTKWTNKMASKILDKHPNLEIQFGLHATSVKDKLQYIQNVDPRVHIIWEDCGAFPYSYHPNKIGDFEQTKELNKKIADLRGDEERFGVVLKGLISLDWNKFEHQKGRFVLGKASEQFIKERTADRRGIWKYVQAYWIKNAKYAQEIIRDMSEIRGGNLCIQALVEDGMFENKIWYPVAVYAELLWDYDKEIGDILCDTALREDVEMA